jgi:hypothetical protein
VPDSNGLTERQAFLNILLSAEQAARQARANIVDQSGEYYSNLLYNTRGTGYYQKFLGRTTAPSSQETAPFINELSSGVTGETVISQIVSSDEYFNRAPTITGDGGPPSNSEFVKALYFQLLNRTSSTVSAAEINAQVVRLQQGATRASIALGLMNSDEYRIIVVQGYYKQLFNRQPAANSVEIQPWVAMLRNGAKDEQLLSILASSGEYFAIHAGSDRGCRTWTRTLSGGSSRMSSSALPARQRSLLMSRCWPRPNRAPAAPSRASSSAAMNTWETWSTTPTPTPAFMSRIFTGRPRHRKLSAIGCPL